MTKKLCVVGLGYIGLPTAVMFANHGVPVHGVDVNERAVNMIRNKQLHIEENGLQERLDQAIDSGMLSVSTEPIEADVFIVAVPSPIREDRTADLEYVRKATASIVPYLKKGNLVILESTVPPKTVEHIMLPELEKTGLQIGEELFVAHSPERVIPGRIFEELEQNGRIIGGINDKSAEMTKELYEAFVKGPIELTDATTAELVKVMENTYRDVNIAFANEMAKIGEHLDVNIWDAIRFANFHPRVNIHQPGPGVGGHCIAVDPWFLVELAPEQSNIIHLSRKTNDGMPAFVADRVMQFVGDTDRKIAVLGLSFKADVDDMRQSPSIDVIRSLEEKGFTVSSYDPHVNEGSHPTQVATAEEAADGASMILVLTNHQEFMKLNPDEIAGRMAERIVYDTKNCLDLAAWKAAGFKTYLLGDHKENTNE
ncbi:nucleotide sugar dehydrogenase [Bhargavaea cecembensis]|uniref:nucleotide sugar dehydrogenase n=1 Tax=Bhargavaea cecembensis TaxID=394098 RepID=UPI00058E26A7|nr:nucleotide sugar dehydrogenase [Bhargavaea cecembensis]